MSFLRDLALAHQKKEVFFAPGQNAKFPNGTLSWRNHNPGNLRLTPYQMKAYGAVEGAGGFTSFPTYDFGLEALQDDLKAKITGHSAHLDYSKPLTFLDYVRVFAPEGDGNDPNEYCSFLCKQLSQYGLTPKTPLTQLAALIQRDETPVPVIMQDPATRLKIAEEALNRVGGLRKFVLQQTIIRLKRMIGGVQ